MPLEWDDEKKILWDDESVNYQPMLESAEGPLAFASDIVTAIPRGYRMLGEMAFGADVPTAMERAESTPTYKPFSERGKETKKSIDEFFERYMQEFGQVFSKPEAALVRDKWEKRTLTLEDLKGEAIAQSTGEAIGNVWAPGIGGIPGRRARRYMSPEQLASETEAKRVAGETLTKPEPQFDKYSRLEDPYQEYAPQKVEPSLESTIGLDEYGRTQLDVNKPSILELTEEPTPAVFRRRGEEGQLRAPKQLVEATNFPLRQEVLDTPAMRIELDNYQRWIEQAKQEGNTQLATELRADFGEMMRQYGVDKPQDAFGRALYEQGVEPKLPIEKSKPLGEAPTNFNPLIDPDQLTVGGKFVSRPSKVELKQLGPIEKSISWNKESGAVDPVVIDKMLRSVERLTGVFPKSIEAAEAQLKRGIDRAMDTRDVTGRAVLQQKLGELSSFKSQRGSVKDPQFLKFKDALPKPMQKHASRLYKEWLSENPTPIEIYSGERVVAAMEGVPGLDKALKYVKLEERHWDEVRADILANEKDITWKGMNDIPVLKHFTSKGAQFFGENVTPGTALTALAKKSTIIKLVGDSVDVAKTDANKLKHDLLLNKKTGLKPLVEHLKGDMVEAWNTLRSREGLSDDVSAVTPKQEAVVKLTREVLNKIYDDINDQRVALGWKPIPKRLGYLPGIFDGDFQFMVYKKHADGRMEAMKRYGRDNRWQAENYLKQLKEKFPDLEFGKVEHRATSKSFNRADREAALHELSRVLEKDDPRLEAIESAFAELVEQDAYDYQGFKRHFMPKKKEAVKGAEGFYDQGLISPLEDAKRGFQATLKYMEHSMDWLEMQKAGQQVRKILNDVELQSKFPNTLHYANYFWNTVSGRGTFMSHALDGVTNLIAYATGIGESNLREGTRAVKSALTIMTLTHPAFATMQIMQPLQFMPHWLTYLHSEGLGSKASGAYAYTLGNLDVTNYIGGKFTKDLVTPLGLEAMDWAKKGYRLQSYILDDIRPKTVERLMQSSRDIAGWPLRQLEEYSRANSFLQFVHYLDNAGALKVLSKEQLFDTAIRFTNMAMVDYRQHSRPLGYQQFGAVGELASTLTAFKHNQYGQLFTMGAQKSKIPLYTMIGTQLLAAGTMGMFFREEIDDLIKLFNEGVAKPLKWDNPLPTVQEALLSAPEKFKYLVWGGLSPLTGMDWSSRLSAANPVPNSLSEAVFAYSRDVGNKVMDTIKLLTSPSEAQALKTAHTWAPTWGKGAIEQLGTEENTPAYNPQTEEGHYDRNKFDWFSRHFGARSLEESKAMIARRERDYVKRYDSELMTSLIEGASKNPNKIEKNLEQYLRHGGTKEEFMNAIVAYHEKKATTPEQREKLNTLRQQLQYLWGPR